MELLEQLGRDEKLQADRLKLLRKHETAILTGYGELDRDLREVLNKHMPGIISRDRELDADVSLSEGRQPTPAIIVFLALTAEYLSGRIEKLIAEYILERMQELAE